jgi:hypothetical protein
MARCLIARKGFNGITVEPAHDESRKALEKETNLKLVPLADQTAPFTHRPFADVFKGYKV